MVLAFSLYLISWLLKIGHIAKLTGCLAGFLALAINRRMQDGGKSGIRLRIYEMLGMISLIPPFCWLIVLGISAYSLTSLLWPPTPSVYTWLGSAIASSFIAMFLLRTGVQVFDRATTRLTKKTALERNRKTDIRYMGKHVPQSSKRYDPRQYFDQEKGMLIGLDERGTAVFIPHDEWKLRHVSLVGGTRLGKGVAAQTLLYQSIRYGEFVVVLDPKNDEWMPSVFYQACMESNKKYRFVDLRQGRPLQCNPFYGCDEECLENMLIGGFSLSEKGEAADFYRLADRKAARQAAKWLSAHPNATARDLLQADADCTDGLPGEWFANAPAFHSYVAELAEIDAINHPGGSGFLDITEGAQAGAEGGGCLYVVGDMINTRLLRAQKMILLRLLFLVKQRGYAGEGMEKPRSIALLADEFRVHISAPFMVSLGASAGWGLHTILAFQSFKDLANCPADLDKVAVEGGVMENCQIKLCYSIEDPETAEEYAKSTGKIQVDDEARKITKTLALAEKVDAERTIRQSETFLMDTNIMSSLKAGVSVVKMPQQLATFCLTSPIPVKKDERSTVPTGHPPETVARYQAEVGAIGRSLATAAADALLPSSAEDQ